MFSCVPRVLFEILFSRVIALDLVKELPFSAYCAELQVFELEL